MTNFSMPASGFEICALEDIPDGRGRVFSFPTTSLDFSLLVLRTGNCCYGYINRCPHFGMPLATCDSQLICESGRWVKCNVHYARFRWQDGICDEGECVGESLQKVPLEVKNCKILVAAFYAPNTQPIMIAPPPSDQIL